MFLKSAAHGSGSNLSRTENGAITYKTTGSLLVDQFGTAGSYRGRNISDVFGDQATLDSVDRRSAVQFIFYLRMITRKYGEDLGVNKGQGSRDEAFKRLLWYLYSAPEVFYDNLDLLTYVGSFRDLWDIAYLADENGIHLDEERLFAVYTIGLQDEARRDLAIKYLPQIVSTNKVKSKRAATRNRLAKRFASYLGLSFQEYRKLKTSGHAHRWQQAISAKDFNSINFNRIPGRALSKLVGSRFLKNQRLEADYDAWLQTQPVAKFTGYAYELGDAIKTARKSYQQMTINKQFEGLVDLARQDGGLENTWVALDTSGSMGKKTAGGATTALNVTKSLGIYFAALNEGAFKDQVVMFSERSTLASLTGDFITKYNQIPSNAMGNTNFQSVIDLLAKTRRENPSIPLEDYPTTILVVSDMQFDPTETRYDAYFGRVNRNVLTASNINTNHAAMMQKLKGVFPQSYINKLKIVWWNVTDRNSAKNTFHSTNADGGTYYVSGFDGAVISTILGGEEVVDDYGNVRQPTAEERVEAALSQPVLELVNA